jgi:hypothetical protein
VRGGPVQVARTVSLRVRREAADSSLPGNRSLLGAPGSSLAHLACKDLNLRIENDV